MGLICGLLVYKIKRHKKAADPTKEQGIGEEEVTKKAKRIFTAGCCLLLCACAVYAELDAAELPGALQSIAAEDGSVWERVSVPGFGDAQNLSITAMVAYGGRIMYTDTGGKEDGAWKYIVGGDALDP